MPNSRHAVLLLWLVACGTGGGPTTLAPVDGGDSGRPDAATPLDGGPSDAASDAGDAGDAPNDAPDGSANRLQTVFLIMMENHDFSTIATSRSADYINGTLLPMGGHAENYTTTAHPSEKNYVWLESGAALVPNDDGPQQNHLATTDHLVTLLANAKIPWKAYAEDISGKDCPLVDKGLFVTRHVPQLFFDDTTDVNNSSSTTCIEHIRPYEELSADLAKGTVARYNFITPNLCNDMHGFPADCGPNYDPILAGDTWLSTEVPKIMQSDAYKNNGVIFVLWDEGDSRLFTASDGPIPLIVLSPKGKPGYTSATKFTHSSTLRTLQEIFGVTPLLRDAANATDLAEFFTSFP